MLGRTTELSTTPKILSVLSGKVASNSLEDPARVRGAVRQVVVDPSRQHLLRETHHVRLDVEMFVAPHLAGGATSSLDLVHHQGDVVLLTDGRQPLEELWTAVVVASLGLYGLRDNASHRVTGYSLQ